MIPAAIRDRYAGPLHCPHPGCGASAILALRSTFPPTRYHVDESLCLAYVAWREADNLAEEEAVR